jgi:hypothetical protein
MVRGVGFPSLDAFTKPEQPLLTSTAPSVNRIRMQFRNGRPEIPDALRKPLMIPLNFPSPAAFLFGGSTPISRPKAELFPAPTRLGGATQQFYWSWGQLRGRGSYCPKWERGLLKCRRKDYQRDGPRY